MQANLRHNKLPSISRVLFLIQWPSPLRDRRGRGRSLKAHVLAYCLRRVRGLVLVQDLERFVESIRLESHLGMRSAHFETPRRVALLAGVETAAPKAVSAAASTWRRRLCIWLSVPWNESIMATPPWYFWRDPGSAYSGPVTRDRGSMQIQDARSPYKCLANISRLGVGSCKPVETCRVELRVEFPAPPL